MSLRHPVLDHRFFSIVEFSSLPCGIVEVYFRILRSLLTGATPYLVLSKSIVLSNSLVYPTSII